ncbi:unnamed protein product [Sphagnum balticum]
MNMAHLYEPNDEMKSEWAEFVSSRPDAVRKVAERFNPWTLYRIGKDGHRVTLYSFGEHEDGSVTLTVNVTGEFNCVVFERRVFGIKPEDLEECDLPAEGEIMGALLHGEEVDDNIDALRVMVRPDLFEMNEDGEAVRKQPTH